MKNEKIKIKNRKIEIFNRIKRAKGQVKGIERMIEEEKGCLAIIQQIQAARSALAKIASMILTGESCKMEKARKPHEFGKIIEALMKNI